MVLVVSDIIQSGFCVRCGWDLFCYLHGKQLYTVGRIFGSVYIGVSVDTLVYTHKADTVGYLSAPGYRGEEGDAQTDFHILSQILRIVALYGYVGSYAFALEEIVHQVSDTAVFGHANKLFVFQVFQGYEILFRQGV